MILCLLLLHLTLRSTASGTARHVVTLALHSQEDIILREKVSQDQDLELRIQTNFSDESKHSIFMRSELLDPGEEDLRTHLGYNWSPLFFHAGQSGVMKSWQVGIILVGLHQPLFSNSRYHYIQSPKRRLVSAFSALFLGLRLLRWGSQPTQM